MNNKTLILIALLLAAILAILIFAGQSGGFIAGMLGMLVVYTVATSL